MASMLWATSAKRSGGGSNFVAPGFQFPASLQFNPDDVRRGAIKVVAKAPSGTTFPLDVIESDGLYTTNFAPSEIGDWQISILFEGEHIQGSPFNVRVYDPGLVRVTGLTSGAVGRPFNFSVDTTGAGDGQLAIDVTQYDRSVTSRVVPDNFGHYDVNFTPDRNGPYAIRVYFAGLEVTGSPFSVDAVDSSGVTVSGDGIGFVPVNRPTTFRVNTGRNNGSSSELQVNITSPRGLRLSPNISNARDGSFLVEFLPDEVGIYSIDIKFHSIPITGSPFSSRSYDPTKVTVADLHPMHTMGNDVQFDIDVSSAGEGDLEIMVNDGTIPCSVANLVNRRYRVSFSPKKPGQHSVEIKFNGDKVAGSPWHVDVKDLSKITVTGSGLQSVPIGRPAAFEINCGGSALKVTTNIKGPNGRSIATKLVNHRHGVHKFEYTPTDVGSHSIDVTFNGSPVQGSPFSSKAYSANAIKVSPVAFGVVGQPVEFNVDVTQAGEGQLEIMVNKGACPNTVRLVSKGVFQVSFLPRNSNPHLVNISFNGQPLSGGVITIPIIDQSKIQVGGSGITLAAVNQKSVFHVNTQSAGSAELHVKIKSSNDGLEIPAVMKGNSKKGFDVEYITTQTGNYRVDVEYGGVAVQGSPFTIKSFDISRIKISGVENGIVGQKSSFMADVENAGEGNMEISVTSSNGRNIPNHVQQQATKTFLVTYTPSESGIHRANITFNGQHVPGSPFTFHVSDMAKVTAQGSGLDSVACNKNATFTITGPGLRKNDLEINIIGPTGHPLLPRIHSTAMNNSVSVDYTPSAIGDHEVTVKYHGHSIPGSPFRAHAWDASKVIVSDIPSGSAHQQTKFQIDASQAGFGNLEIIVSCGSENIPNFVTAEGSGNFSVSFTPLKAETHSISVKFNGEPVRGSPFFHSVLDGRRATASGEGLGLVLAKRPTTFVVRTREVGGVANLSVEVLDSNNEPVPVQISGSDKSDFRVVYTPMKIGRYTVTVSYADAEISGSPFHPDVFDTGDVVVFNLLNGTLGKPVAFTVDTSAAGEGRLSVRVKGQKTQPSVDVTTRSPGQYVAEFQPQESGPHQVYVQFNELQVPGSPFECVVFDSDLINAKWDSARLCPVNTQVQIQLQNKGKLQGKVTSKVTDPYGQSVNSYVDTRGSDNVVEFIAQEVGPHTVELFYGSEHINGSPFTSNIYDSSRVKILEVPKMALIGQQVAFSVDTSEAGKGDLNVDVVSGNKTIAKRRDQTSDVFRQRFSFVPTLPSNHMISVTFNGEHVNGSPIVVTVANPRELMSIDPHQTQDGVVVGSVASATIDSRGHSIDLSDINVKVNAPGGEIVPSNLLQAPDGNIKLEYSPRHTGRHTVSITYANEPIMGSPFNVEVFDPHKVKVDGKMSWITREMVEFDINELYAGKADLGVTIKGPRGSSVPFDVYVTPQGHHITYTPNESGAYQICITYGGLNIPGCPVVHSVIDGVMAVAHGEGLVKGIKDKATTFTVDPKGQRGDLVVQVDGPNSIAKCNIEPGPKGIYRIRYVPVEVGVYNIIIQWNGKPIEGCPFRPKIFDPSRVDVVGGWQSILDNKNKMPLTVHQSNSIQFDTRSAGPGHLSAEVTFENSAIPVDVVRTDNDRYTLTFLPRVIGNYDIQVFWNDIPLPRCPIVGVATSPTLSRQVSHSTTSAIPLNTDKVFLTGQGLHAARVDQRSDFVIDGTEAGPGSPEIHLIGLNSEVNVQCVSLGGQKYQCFYTPTAPGSYLLNIMWSNHQVRGSPFKVAVTAGTGSNAARVTFIGDALNSGVVGQEVKSIIDTRRAGSGELSVQCTGPTKTCYCELTDHRDGTFTLSFKPQEPGRHRLEIKYGDEHITGSPFLIRVSASPDASKVSARGPGLEHGVLTTFRSHFIVDTTGAGAGQLTVRVRGPKDAFHVEMERDKHKERLIVCRFDPTESGDYIVHIKWSDVHVPGSPFHVHIFDTEKELRSFLANDARDAYSDHQAAATPSPNVFDSVTFSQ